MFLGGSLANLLLLHLRNLSAVQHSHRAVVHLVNHVVPYLCTLQLEDEQWVFLLVAGVLYRVTQFVKLAQILLP